MWKVQDSDERSGHVPALRWIGSLKKWTLVDDVGSITGGIAAVPREPMTLIAVGVARDV